MDDFERLKKKISDDRNFSCNRYNDPYLKRRFAIRMRATGAKSYREYMKVLDNDKDEYPTLLDALTVNVTEFFRDNSVFDEIGRVLRSLVEEKRKDNRNTLRIWSAGCSSGAEAYSVAILLHQVLGSQINDFRITIYATDIDDASLAKGRQGIYDPNILKGIKRTYLTKYFNQVDGGYQVIEPLRKIVTFKRHDLINERALPMMDMILCRNAVIYFSRDLQEKLFINFYRSLNDGGYFIMGKTETLIGEAKDKFKSVNNKERIYQR